MKEQKITRKSFLKGAGTSLAGIALLGGAGALLSGCEEEELKISGAVASSLPDAPKWPFNYKKLDPDVAAQKGYDGYKKGG